MESDKDLLNLRRELLELLAESLNKNSRFYKEDYENMRAGVERKSRSEVIQALNTWRAIRNVTKAEIAFHCQLGGLPALGHGSRQTRGRAA